MLIEETQFLLSADRCGVDKSVESCFPSKERTVCFIAREMSGLVDRFTLAKASAMFLTHYPKSEMRDIDFERKDSVLFHDGE